VNATARVTANAAFTSQKGFSAITHPATGEYQLTLSSPPADLNNLTVVATQGPTSITFPVNTAGFVAFSLTAPNQILVFTKDDGNNLADLPFSVVAYDLT
jgi:hypothetical protein